MPDLIGLDPPGFGPPEKPPADEIQDPEKEITDEDLEGWRFIQPGDGGYLATMKARGSVIEYRSIRGRREYRIVRPWYAFTKEMIND